MPTIPEYFGFAISIFTLIGIGYKSNEELGKIRKELVTNTETTKEAKESTLDSSQQLKAKLEEEFVRLQKFNGTRYRELYVAQTEQHVQIALLLEKVKKLEEQIEQLTRNNQS